MSRIIDRIERSLGLPGIVNTLATKLAPRDLQSLLLAVYKQHIERKKPSEVLSDYEHNRFVGVSSVSSRLFAQWDRLAYEHLPPGFEPVELSPLCPLGTCSVVAGISQDWSVSTSRNTEVVSDPTNVLALEAATKRREMLRNDPRCNRRVRLAASHRVVRAQPSKGAGRVSHFRLFVLCSAGRATGDRNFELVEVLDHVSFYLTSIRAFLGFAVPLRVSFTVHEMMPSYGDAAKLIVKSLAGQFECVRFDIRDRGASESNYYKGMRFQIYGQLDSGNEQNLVDGGVVDWTQKYLNNAKERLVISGVGVDRLCSALTWTDPT